MTAPFLAYERSPEGSLYRCTGCAASLLLPDRPATSDPPPTDKFLHKSTCPHRWTPTYVVAREAPTPVPSPPSSEES